MSTIKLIDTAYEIFKDLDEPSDLSIPAIMFWLRASTNLGVLNSLLGKNYYINTANLELEDSTLYTEKESAIYGKLYELYYVNKKIKENLGAAAIDSVTEVTDTMGGRIRRTSKNEIAKVYLQLRKDLALEFSNLLTDYGINAMTPLDVSGTDTIPGRYNPRYSDYNRGNYPNI